MLHLYFTTFRKHHRHNRLLHYFFFYFKELMQRYLEFFNYPNISSLFLKNLQSKSKTLSEVFLNANIQFIFDLANIFQTFFCAIFLLVKSFHFLPYLFL